jgi:hypothetical protein
MKKLGFLAIAPLAMLLLLSSPPEAKARTHFGLYVGPSYAYPDPYYSNIYPYQYPYSYPLYPYSGYGYGYPYYGYGYHYGHGHRDFGERHGHYSHGFGHGYGHGYSHGGHHR